MYKYKTCIPTKMSNAINIYKLLPIFPILSFIIKLHSYFLSYSLLSQVFQIHDLQLSNIGLKSDLNTNWFILIFFLYSKSAACSIIFHFHHVFVTAPTHDSTLNSYFPFSFSRCYALDCHAYHEYRYKNCWYRLNWGPWSELGATISTTTGSSKTRLR